MNKENHTSSKPGIKKSTGTESTKISVKGKILNILGFADHEAKMKTLCRQYTIRENKLPQFLTNFKI